VKVFGFDGPRTVGNFKELETLHNVASPLRIGYDSVTNTVAVASLDLDKALERQSHRTDGPDPNELLDGPNLYMFDAASRRSIRNVTVRSARRGLINFESILSAGGLIFCPGFDTQTVVILDAETSAEIATIYFPYCPGPKGFCDAKFKSPLTAQADKDGGANNWSGGKCDATMRNPWDVRFSVFDGPTWVPISPAWAKPKELVNTTVKSMFAVPEVQV